MTNKGDVMTSAFPRRLAVVAAAVVGIVFASSAANADAATSHTHAKVTHKVHVVPVAPSTGTGNTYQDWWW